MLVSRPLRRTSLRTLPPRSPVDRSYCRLVPSRVRGGIQKKIQGSGAIPTLSCGPGTVQRHKLHHKQNDQLANGPCCSPQNGIALNALFMRPPVSGYPLSSTSCYPLHHEMPLVTMNPRTWVVGHPSASLPCRFPSLNSLYGVQLASGAKEYTMHSLRDMKLTEFVIRICQDGAWVYRSHDVLEMGVPVVTNIQARGIPLREQFPRKGPVPWSHSLPDKVLQVKYASKSMQCSSHISKMIRFLGSRPSCRIVCPRMYYVLVQ